MKLRILVCGLLALLLSVHVGAQSTQAVVIASHSILADVARNVAGDHLDIRSLIPRGSDPHTFIPTPSDLAAVAEADLVLINGLGYEESLLEAIENAGESVNISMASACIDIRPLGVHEDEDEHAHEDEDEHAHEDDDEHAHEDDDEHAHEDDDKHAHEDDDEHAHEDDDEHAHEDDDEHAHDDDDEHAHEDDDEHAHEDEDEHAHDDEDEHAHDDEDEHAHEDDDEHAHDDDDEHAHDDDDEHAHDDELTGCDAQDAEFHAIGGHGHGEFLGRAEDIECEAHDHHGDESGGDHHEDGACDPHIWFDPQNVIRWALSMRDSFSAIDPDHAADYHERTLAYAEQLISLERDFIWPALENLPVEKRVLVTAHDALGYLAGTFDFEVVSTVIPGVSTAVEPSARDVAGLIDLIRQQQLPAIFGESTTSDKILQAIARETDVEIMPLYTDSLGEVAGPAGTYLDFMRYNFSAIIEALSG